MINGDNDSTCSSDSAEDLSSFGSEICRADCQCPICYSFFCEPLTLDCKHSFCRACLLEVTHLSPDGRSCPMCRACINIHSPADHNTDAELEGTVLALGVGLDAYKARQAKDAKRIQELVARVKVCLPIYSLGNVGSFRAGRPIMIRFFEPRYEVLVRRAWQGNHLFIYAPDVLEGTPAVIVRIDRARFKRNGFVDIIGSAVESVQIEDVWTAEGTEGLMYGRVTTTISTGAISQSPPHSQHTIFPRRSIPLTCSTM
mmetsp:Transcript_65162/g.112045  ORF Transcript_65162/g.112045 Transcript_65162/m.112045 type:complete len:257 (+) Transcript_65162:131-901(+)